MENELKRKQILLQEFQIQLDNLLSFFKQYPDDYVELQTELQKAVTKNKLNLQYIEQKLK